MIYFLLGFSFGAMTSFIALITIFYIIGRRVGKNFKVGDMVVVDSLNSEHRDIMMIHGEIRKIEGIGNSVAWIRVHGSNFSLIPFSNLKRVGQETK